MLTRRKGPKNAKLLSGQFFHIIPVPNKYVYANNNQNLIPATFGHWGLFLLVACFHWEKGFRKKIRTPFSISPTVSESPDQGPSKNTGVCPKKIGSRGNCPSFVGCNTGVNLRKANHGRHIYVRVWGSFGWVWHCCGCGSYYQPSLTKDASKNVKKHKSSKHGWMNENIVENTVMAFWVRIWPAFANLRNIIGHTYPKWTCQGSQIQNGTLWYEGRVDEWTKLWIWHCVSGSGCPGENSQQ